MGHCLWGDCWTQDWRCYIPPDKTALNFCLTLLAEERCPQAQMTALSYRDMVKMSIARQLPDHHMAMHKSCIYPSTLLCRRGMGKVFPRSKTHERPMARVWASTSGGSSGFVTLARSLTYTEPQFPHLKNEESSPPARVWGLEKIMHVEQPGTKSDAEHHY